MLFATDKVDKSGKSIYLYYGIIFLVGLFFFFVFLQSINRLARSEDMVEATLVEREIKVTRYGNRSILTYETKDGRKYSTEVIHGPRLQILSPLEKGSEVKLLLSRGIFWTEIKEIHNEEKVYKVF